MRRHAWVQSILLLLMMFRPDVAVAQENDSASGTTPIERPGPLVLAGAGFAVAHINCQLCVQEFPYRRAASVLGGVGYRVTRRVNLSGEAFWIPTNTTSGRVRTLHLDAVAQFQPWASRGLFVKGGWGMAFVRNWIDVPGTSPITSKALSVMIGAGWEFRPAARVGYQFFAGQYATALGDVRTTLGDVQNVLGNFWSVGSAIVIR